MSENQKTSAEVAAAVIDLLETRGKHLSRDGWEEMLDTVKTHCDIALSASAEDRAGEE